MSRRSKAVSDALYEQAKKSLKELGRGGEAGRRLQAILSAKVHGIKAVAAIYDITRTTLMSWIKNFQEESISGLSIKAGRGRTPFLSLKRQEEIREIVKGSPTLTLRELKQHIAEQYSVVISLSTAHRLMKKLSFAYITPRPTHHKSNKSTQEEFKKKLQAKIEQEKHKKLFFFDESRFGTHSNIGHGWFEKGKRTSIPVKIGFKNENL